jgi:hypothetical protein
MRYVPIAAIAAAVMLGLPVNQSEALTIAPIDQTAVGEKLVIDVRHRYGGRVGGYYGGGGRHWRHGGYGRRHYGHYGGGHHYGGNLWWGVPAIGLGLSVIANPYYYPRPYYGRPYYGRPYYYPDRYYGQRCPPTAVNCSDGTKPPYYDR